MNQPTILFVDDERCVLDVMRISLQPQSYRWNMLFVDSGQAALTVFEQQPVDVLVCDLRMPGIDGATVLTRVRRDHPNTIRIVLSGHTEHELTLESLHATHRFLAKPARPEHVRDAIERSLALRETLRNEALVMAMSGLTSVPSLPQIYDELMAALAEGNTTSADIGAIIERDVGLSATILKLVNSSFYGLFRHVESPAQAAGLLGTDVVKNIALTEKLFSQFEGEDVDIDFFVELNRLSNLDGMLAARMARQARIPRRSADHCQIAGLLSRLGELLIEARLKEHPLVVEGTLGADMISGYMLKLWNMPDPIVDAVTNQHIRPPRAEGNVMPTHLLHALRYLQGMLPLGEEPDAELRDELLADLAEFLPAQCVEKWLRIYTGWQIETSDPRGLRRQRAQALDIAQRNAFRVGIPFQRCRDRCLLQQMQAGIG